eukprot:Gb_39801 [translate_table: standard]
MPKSIRHITENRSSGVSNTSKSISISMHVCIIHYMPFLHKIQIYNVVFQFPPFRVILHSIRPEKFISSPFDFISHLIGSEAFILCLFAMKNLFRVSRINFSHFFTILQGGFSDASDESICTSPFSDIKMEQCLWNRLNKRAKSILVDKECSITPDSSINTNEFYSREHDKPQKYECVEARSCTKTVCQEDSTLLEKGLEAVASSSCQLSKLSKTLWTFVELLDLLPGDPEKVDLYTPRQQSLKKAEQKPCEEERYFKVSASKASAGCASCREGLVDSGECKLCERKSISSSISGISSANIARCYLK